MANRIRYEAVAALLFGRRLRSNNSYVVIVSLVLLSKNPMEKTIGRVVVHIAKVAVKW